MATTGILPPLAMSAVKLSTPPRRPRIITIDTRITHGSFFLIDLAILIIKVPISQERAKISTTEKSIDKTAEPIDSIVEPKKNVLATSIPKESSVPQNTSPLFLEIASVDIQSTSIKKRNPPHKIKIASIVLSPQ